MLLADSLSATFASRVASVIAVRGAALRSVLGDVSIGNPVRFVGTSSNVAFMRGALEQTSVGEVLIKDRYGNVDLIARASDTRTTYFDPSRRAIGYSEQRAQTIAHYDTTGGSPRFIGRDDVDLKGVIRHYDANGRRLGETRVTRITSPSNDVLIVLAFAPLGSAHGVPDRCSSMPDWALEEICRDATLTQLSRKVVRLDGIMTLIGERTSLMDSFPWQRKTTAECERAAAPAECLRTALAERYEQLKTEIPRMLAREPKHHILKDWAREQFEREKW